MQFDAVNFNLYGSFIRCVFYHIFFLLNVVKRHFALLDIYTGANVLEEMKWLKTFEPQKTQSFIWRKSTISYWVFEL